MKKALLTGISVFISTLIWAQANLLYGTTYAGGAHGMGTLFSYNLTTSKETVLINFDTASGINPLGSMIIDTNTGILYGTTYIGGSKNDGVMFSYNPATSKDTNLIVFNGVNGEWPQQGSLTLFNGMVYGMTSQGGVYNKGEIFRYDIAAGADSTMVNFNNIGGEYSPLGVGFTYCPLNGLLYGMTCFGGTYDMGTIFTFNPVTGKDSVVLVFDSINGENPQEGQLTFDPTDGLFYGVTSAGGTFDNGVAFSFNPFTGQDSVLINFNKLNGKIPLGSIMLDSLDGLLYGLTNNGGLYNLGVMYSLDPNTGTQKILFNFNDTLGGLPTANLIIGPGGVLYGTANRDKTSNGLIFSYDPSSSKYTVVYKFTSTSGKGPYGSLLMAKAPVITGVNATSAAQHVSVFPNPFNSSATILFNETGMHYVELVDVMGRTIENIQTEEKQYILQRNSLTTGIYFLRIFNNDRKEMAVKKIAVN